MPLWRSRGTFIIFIWKIPLHACQNQVCSAQPPNNFGRRTGIFWWDPMTRALISIHATSITNCELTSIQFIKVDRSCYFLLEYEIIFRFTFKHESNARCMLERDSGFKLLEEDAGECFHAVLDRVLGYRVKQVVQSTVGMTKDIVLDPNPISRHPLTVGYLIKIVNICTAQRESRVYTPLEG